LVGNEKVCILKIYLIVNFPETFKTVLLSFALDIVRFVMCIIK